MGSEFWMLVLCALLLPAFGLLGFLSLDSYLTLLWAAWLGRCPEQALTGMVVWITGASSGIGEELAFQLSKLGVFLVLSARRVQELERVKRRCLENGIMKEKDILVLPLDLADTSSHDIATKAVLQEFGRIDILVNNGGESHRCLAVDANLDVFKVLMEVNYLGTVSLTKCVLPHMMKRKQGKIVIMNSLAGIVPSPLCSGYIASKHALRGFANALRTELLDHPGITLSTICPGLVHSNIFQNYLTRKAIKVRRPKLQETPKMATSRCVQLILVSMANHLKEVWIADQPALFRTYVWQYVPIRDWIIQGRNGRKELKYIGLTRPEECLDAWEWL
ncbi:LOW QUALITY PROTEIN: dehydrogenase/reductase SDR family member 7-like [Mus pahari]|uniref:LOW QUALITY PROTEIN: dehydrogenase/reductase SDR family member 7-like n=1 Tax=Mus pahari TaxID=10093 RepID=UPI001114BB46|nr:LOW QUALITY PROTEIN: dehydrogenase/reductase SDR family member 7-like [Mus pahari]